MAKEADMIQPNHLGHFHRDIISVESTGTPWWRYVNLSCGHRKLISTHAAKKYRNDALICMLCTNPSKCCGAVGGGTFKCVGCRKDICSKCAIRIVEDNRHTGNICPTCFQGDPTNG